MNVELPAESIFVARNWETISEIIEAAQRLRNEMGRMLTSLEDDLHSMEWWADGWVFVVRDPGQVYISRQAWRMGDQYLVWIGVDRFRPASVFGIDDPPYLYAYVWGRRYELRDELMKTLDEETVLGEIGPGGNSLIVVQQTVAKCLPEGVEGYLDQAREQIMTFLDHHLRMADTWNPIVQRYISE